MRTLCHCKALWIKALLTMLSGILLTLQTTANVSATDTNTYTMPSIAIFSVITCNRTFMRCPVGWEDCNGQVIDTKCSNGAHETVYVHCCRKMHDSCPPPYQGYGIDRRVDISLDGKKLSWQMLKIDCCKEEKKSCTELKPGYTGYYKEKTCITWFDNIPELTGTKTTSSITYLSCHKCVTQNIGCPDGYQGEKLQKTCYHLEIDDQHQVREVIDPGYPKIVKDTCYRKECYTYDEACNIHCRSECKVVGKVTKEKCYKVRPNGERTLLYTRKISDTCKCQCPEPPPSNKPCRGGFLSDAVRYYHPGARVYIGWVFTSNTRECYLTNENTGETWQVETEGEYSWKTPSYDKTVYKFSIVCYTGPNRSGYSCSDTTTLKPEEHGGHHHGCGGLVCTWSVHIRRANGFGLGGRAHLNQRITISWHVTDVDKCDVYYYHNNSGPYTIKNNMKGTDSITDVTSRIFRHGTGAYTVYVNCKAFDSDGRVCFRCQGYKDIEVVP